MALAADTNVHELALDGVMLLIEAESTILIAQEYAFHPKIRAEVQRVKARYKDRVFECQYVSMDKIEQRRGDAELEEPDVVRTQSDMERAATDLFRKAVNAKASDIHVRVNLKGRTQIYFRVHNDLELVEQHPASYGQQLCSAIYHSLADVSDATYDEQSRQDARIANKKVLPSDLDGIRIATTPQVDGNIMVMRLLYDTAGSSDDICDLGFDTQQRAYVQVLKKRTTGIIVVTGPTGSGKSTTLQRVLRSLIRETNGKKHIITVEDPPEYQIPGAVQTPVTNADTEEKRSAAFQEAIKGAMRLDPDVIMIGEMRDSPSARLALQAAMTGHQVWSTLHANGSFHAVTRLLDMGLDINALTDPSILSGVISQRLLKELCDCKQSLSSAWDKYKETRPTAEEEFSRIQTLCDIDQIYVRGSGCTRCNQTGVKRRTVVGEIVVTDHKMMSHLRRHDTVAAMEYWQQELGGMSMIDHAIEKVKAGRVDPFEAEDVLGPLVSGLAYISSAVKGA